MAERGASHREPHRILVIDDEQSARDTTEALLHLDGHQLAFATNGHEGLLRLGRAPVDLILCDVMMPGMDGLEVCRRVKAHPEWRFVPLILVTALDAPEDMVRGIDAGADELLTKPLQRVVLRARVRAMLRVREHYAQARGGGKDLESLLRARREQLAAEAGLTAREREVLDLLLLGRTQEEIGKVLHISARTAKFHQQNVLRKLGADSRADLTRLFL